MRPPRRSRLRRTLPWLTALLLAAPFPVSADDVEPPLPPLAGAEEVGEAMARFEEDFKARGLKGDDKLMQKDHAVLFLSGVPHPKVIDRLYDLARRDRASEVRRMGLTALGKQSTLAAYAGPKVVQLLEDKKLAKDDDHVLACLKALGRLGYHPPVETLEATLRHKDYAVRKQTLALIGELKDVRHLEALLRELGTLDAQEKGESWDGAEAKVDTGSAGDADQKAAEARAKAEAARNKGAAGGKGKGGGSTRDMKDQLLASLEVMTGQDFVDQKDAGTWLEKNPDWRPQAEAELEKTLEREAHLEKELAKAAK
ncbi:MAG: HEAT repeat domain-containing protein [Planctomycetota bacterium]